MPLDKRRVEEARAWLSKADRDFRAARLDLEAEPPLTDDAMFHCRQATEKSLNAFLAWHDVPFRKSHDLRELGGQCGKVDPSLETVSIRAEPLTTFATAFRYPGDAGEPTKQEAEEALEIARSVYEAVFYRLPPEATPQSF